MRVALRHVNAFSFVWLVLRINPHLFLVPEDDLVARVAGEIHYGGAEVGVAVVGEYYDAAEVAIHQAAFARVAGEEDEFLAVAAPVHR